MECFQFFTLLNWWSGAIGNNKYQPVKINRPYVASSLKSLKDLEVVSSFQNWMKSMLEILVVSHRNIWINLISVQPRVQKIYPKM